MSTAPLIEAHALTIETPGGRTLVREVGPALVLAREAQRAGVESEQRREHAALQRVDALPARDVIISRVRRAPDQT